MTKNQKAVQKFELDTDSTYTSHKMIIILIITTNYSDISTRELFFANLDIFHNFLLATARDKVLSTWWAEHCRGDAGKLFMGDDIPALVCEHSSHLR